jgi:hypothetical protein
MTLNALNLAKSVPLAIEYCRFETSGESVSGWNPRYSLVFQPCKVLEADLGPRFKFINLAHQF